MKATYITESFDNMAVIDGYTYYYDYSIESYPADDEIEVYISNVRDEDDNVLEPSSYLDNMLTVQVVNKYYSQGE